MMIAYESFGMSIGARFGTREVLGPCFTLAKAGKSQSARWGVVVRCACGKVSVANVTRLRRGECLECAECSRANNTKHGNAREGRKWRLYTIWLGIKRRCLNHRYSAYANYGGRGIFICNAWLDWPTFREWSLANGYEDHLSIDRVNVNGHYEPSNCRWADKKTQARNTRTNRLLSMYGLSVLLSDLVKISGASHGTVCYHLKRGLTPEQIMERFHSRRQLSIKE